MLSIFATPDAVLRGDAPLRECPLLGAEWWIDGGVDGTIDEEAGEPIVNALDAAATDAGDADTEGAVLALLVLLLATLALFMALNFS